MSHHTRTRKESAASESGSATSRLSPLLCSGCGAPQPVGDGDTVTCPFCGKVTPLSAPYKMLRDAERMSADDAADLEALALDISRPPSVLQRATTIVGYGVGILTLIVVGIGALIGAILGLVGASQLDAGEDLALVLAGLGAIVCGMVSIPFTGEWLVGLAMLGNSDHAYALATGVTAQWSIDALVAAILYGLGVVPIAIAQRTSENVSGVRTLQATLRAQPPANAGGAARCRTCGAALDVQPGALAARCLYCRTDNLLAVPESVAAKHKTSTQTIDHDIQDAIERHDRLRRSDRAKMWVMVALGPLLVPLICGAGWLFHRILGA